MYLRDRPQHRTASTPGSPARPVRTVARHCPRQASLLPGTRAPTISQVCHQISSTRTGPFPWLAEVEAATDEMRAELIAVRDPAAFSPRLRDIRTGRATISRACSTIPHGCIHLWKERLPVPGNTERCPRILHALRNAPLARAYRSIALDTLLAAQAGAHIPPHNGLVNTTHLPPAARRAGSEPVSASRTRFARGSVAPGRSTTPSGLEAWNDSDRTRVILLFDIWRPELTEEGGSGWSSMFRSIVTYNGTKPDWEI